MGRGYRFIPSFKTESRARLALKHAEERVSEIKAVIDDKGIGSSEVKKTEQDFKDNLTLAASLVTEEKAKGNDVSALAKEIDDKFENSKDLLREVYHGHKNDLKSSENDLQNRLKEAVKKGDTPLSIAIEAEIKKITDEVARVDEGEKSVDTNLDQEKNHLENVLGAQQSAESHIANAERARAQVVQQAEARGVATTTASFIDTLSLFDKLLAGAKTAFAAGGFETAKKGAKNAKKMLEGVREQIDAHSLKEGSLERGDTEQRGNDENVSKNKSNERTPDTGASDTSNSKQRSETPQDGERE